MTRAPRLAAPHRALVFLPLLALYCIASACASYRYLSLAPAGAPPAPSPLAYESTRLLFFHGQGDDTLIERLFTPPRGGAPLIATVLRPSAGVAASSDEGATFSFAGLPIDVRTTPRVLRDVLFDPNDPQRLYARAFNGLLVSKDAGQTWQAIPVNDRRGRPVDAIALGPDGTLYVAQGDALYASEDRGETLRALPFVAPMIGVPTTKNAAGEDVRPDPVRIRSVLPDPAHPKTVFLSLEPQPPVENFQRRLIGLLDQTTEEGSQARALFKLPEGKALDRVAFGDIRAGVYVTRDGGRVWQKTALSLDAWLTAHDGAIYAVAAEPLLVAAGLARRGPELAGAIGAQLHENAFDPELLRRACAFPGRSALIGAAPAAPIFRSADSGQSWSYLAAPDVSVSLALRRSFEHQQSGRDPWPPRPFVRPPEEHEGPRNIGPDQPNGQMGRGGRARTAQEMEEPKPPPDLTAPLLSLLEPAGVLSHIGPDLPLTGVSQGEGTLWAYVPTAAYWAQLTEALVRATKRQGELSLGTGQEAPADGNGFQLLRSDDAGASWTESPATIDRYGILSARGIAPYPESVTAVPGQALFVLAGRDNSGKLWRQLLREDAAATAPSPRE